jgi:hypothetical protein
MNRGLFERDKMMFKPLGLRCWGRGQFFHGEGHELMILLIFQHQKLVFSIKILA